MAAKLAREKADKKAAASKWEDREEMSGGRLIESALERHDVLDLKKARVSPMKVPPPPSMRLLIRAARQR
jgi:hypothetical protein